MNEIASIRKACELLDLLAESEKPRGVSELAVKLGFSKPTVYRILQTLLSHGYVNQIDGKYSLGIRLLRLGEAYKYQCGLSPIALPYMERLWRETGETIHLVIRDHLNAYYLEKLESPHPVRMYSRVGEPICLYSTASGKAILAFLSPSELEYYRSKTPLKKRTPNTITDWNRLMEELSLIRKRGYAIDDVENEDGIRCVGSPIFNSAGVVVGAVSVSAPAYRFDMDRVKKCGELVHKCAREISRKLGWRWENEGSSS
ncbi:MAG: IclR family transcriptional regulator [Synergistetes bacterium]|nr:IclR family transcriptional regulator [Synergistota bacterium]